jgi:hypothetical protein
VGFFEGGPLFGSGFFVDVPPRFGKTRKDPDISNPKPKPSEEKLPKKPAKTPKNPKKTPLPS